MTNSERLHQRLRAVLGPLRQRIESIILICLLVFSVAQSAYFNRVDDQQREHDQTQVERNSAENDCQTAYAVALTDALQDRDTVAVLARGASVELWRTFRDLIVNPLRGDRGREVFLDALQDYLRTLRHVSETADINPYPDLAECFNQIDENVAAELALRLSGYTVERHRGKCRGRAVTISSNDQIVVGTDRADVIRTGRGADLVAAGAGKDRICTGKGSDVVNGGRGFDRASCGRGSDDAQQTERQRSC